MGHLKSTHIATLSIYTIPLGTCYNSSYIHSFILLNNYKAALFPLLTGTTNYQLCVRVCVCSYVCTCTWVHVCT